MDYDKNRGNREFNKELLRSLGRVGHLGFTLVLTVFLCLWLGVSIDKWLDLKPIFTLIMLLVGIVSGFFYIFYVVMKKHGK